MSDRDKDKEKEKAAAAAIVLQKKQATQITALEEALVEIIGTVENMAKGIEELETKQAELAKGIPVKKGKFGAHRQKTAVLDTETGITYPSKAAVGRALYGLVDGDPSDTFVYYKICPKFPDRFVDLAEDDPRTQEAWKKQEEDMKAWVEAPYTAEELAAGSSEEVKTEVPEEEKA